jgi:hypothetical protein
MFPPVARTRNSRTCEWKVSFATELDAICHLYGRRGCLVAIGWAMQIRQTTDVVLQALLMGGWRRKPKDKVADPLGSRFTVQQHGLGLVPQASQSGLLDEATRQLP